MVVALAPRGPTLRLPYPHRGQRAVLRSRARHKRLAAGRRWRKTTCGVALALERALEGQRVLWGAPTYDQTRVAWAELRHAAGGALHFLKSELVVEIPGGRGRITLRSMDDPDSARGHSADGTVLDEAADIPEAAWYEVVRPMLADTNGWSLLLGTPKGHNWFWREHIAAADRDDSEAWQIPTLGCRITASGLVRDPHPLESPGVSFAELEAMFATMPERAFRQEILAEFVDDGGGVFRGVAACATGELRDPYPGQFAIGVDWAKTLDFTVLTLMDARTRSVVAHDRFNQVDWAVQSARLEALWRAWSAKGECLILAEANSVGDVLIEALGRRGLPIWPWHANTQSKRELIEALQLDLEQRAISYPPIPTLLAELLAYEATRLPSGTIRYAAPQGLHDDTVISLALAAKATRGMPIQQQQTDLTFVTGQREPTTGGGLLADYRRRRGFSPRGEED